MPVCLYIDEVGWQNEIARMPESKNCNGSRAGLAIDYEVSNHVAHLRVLTLRS